MKLSSRLVLASLLSISILSADSDRVKTAAGIVEGKGPNSSGVREFQGIPFAEPPVGNLRWKPPQPVQPWTGVRQATAFGLRCTPTSVFSDMVFTSKGVSE